MQQIIKIIENCKQQHLPITMSNFIHANRPKSRNEGYLEAEERTKNKSVHKRPSSQYRVRPEELSALKERVKLRNQNKQNNPLFRSENITNMLNVSKSIVMPVSKPSNIIFKKPTINDFDIGDLLGRGAQARVRIAVHKATGSIYSIKTIPRQKVQQNLDSFIRSLKLQMHLDHPNIAKIYDIIVQEKQVHIIMEFCMDGDLSMNRTQFGKEEKGVKNILYKIASGLQYLHNSRIQHRDLKLQNVLYCCGVPKITDFQISVYTKLDFFPRKTICGSPAYFCPEMIQKQRYNKKADIWCLGIIFYELLCGYFPFEINNMNDLTNIVSKQIKQFPSNLSRNAVNLITRMLCKDSEARVSIEQVLSHEFFASMSEDKQSKP